MMLLCLVIQVNRDSAVPAGEQSQQNPAGAIRCSANLAVLNSRGRGVLFSCQTNVKVAFSGVLVSVNWQKRLLLPEPTPARTAKSRAIPDGAEAPAALSADWGWAALPPLTPKPPPEEKTPFPAPRETGETGSLLER